MILNIKTNKKKFFRQALEILSTLPPIDKLRKRELDVLAMLMYYNDVYKNIDEDIRFRIINDTSTRREIQKALDMNEDIFNNNLSIIRKTGVIDHETRLAKFLQIHASDNLFTIAFNFKLQEDEL